MDILYDDPEQMIEDMMDTCTSAIKPGIASNKIVIKDRMREYLNHVYPDWEEFL